VRFSRSGQYSPLQGNLPRATRHGLAGKRLHSRELHLWAGKAARWRMLRGDRDHDEYLVWAAMSIIDKLGLTPSSMSIKCCSGWNTSSGASFSRRAPLAGLCSLRQRLVRLFHAAVTREPGHRAAHHSRLFHGRIEGIAIRT